MSQSPTTPPDHVVETAGSTDPDVPLVVLLHGRGADERDLIGLADQLPPELAYAAPRGPVSLPDGGYTWFENQGLGRPLPASLSASVEQIRGLLGEIAPAPRPIVLVGFSAGALFGGALALTDPQRYAGFALLMGGLPLTVGLPTEDRPLRGMPLLAVHATDDEVMPPQILADAWHWVEHDSGADLTQLRATGGHFAVRQAETLGALRTWLTAHFSG